MIASKSSEKPQLNETAVFDHLYKFQPNAAVFSVIPGFTLSSTSEMTSAVLDPSPDDEPDLPSTLFELFDHKYTSLPDSELSE